ncbi:hypothetical protein SGPA1_20429 [Streptomyces misionensis JCM 4497]
MDGDPRDAVHRARRGVPARLLVPDRDLPRPDLRLRHLLGLRPGLRQDPLRGRQRQAHRPLAPGPLGRVQGGLDRTAALPRAVLPVVGDPGRAAGGDRAGRGERGPRQGGRRDDRRPAGRQAGHGDLRRRRRLHAVHGGRRPAEHHVLREHRRDGRDPRLLHRRLLGRRRFRPALRPVPEVRRHRGRHPGRCPRRHHRHPLRHDRPARRADLAQRQGGPAQPAEPGAGRRGHHHRRRQRQHEVHRQLLAQRHRPRHRGRHHRLPRPARLRPGPPEEAGTPPGRGHLHLRPGDRAHRVVAGRVPPFRRPRGPVGPAGAAELEGCGHDAAGTGHLPRGTGRRDRRRGRRPDACPRRRPARAGRRRRLQPRLPHRHRGDRPAPARRGVPRSPGGHRAGRAVRRAVPDRGGRRCGGPAAARLLAAAVPAAPSSRRTAAPVRARRGQRAHRARPPPRRGGRLPGRRL